MGNDSSKSMGNCPSRQLKIKQFAEDLENEEAPFEDEDEVDSETPPTDDVDYLNDIASDMNPDRLRARFARTQSLQDPVDSAALLINPEEYTYPFENIVLEGGGNKGLAYVGALKCLAELDIIKQIKRIGGASAGAITAALFAVGYDADEIFTFLSADIESVFLDHSCGYFSLIPNLLKSFGWNPGNKIYTWFGDAIEAKTGNPDTSFYELYTSRGIELCVVVTNINLKTAQYCHPKTTPDMPIRDALRMTMSIPGVFAAMEYENHGEMDYFVDGGVLCNYPVNCFDGWFLSMAKKDCFLLKLRPLSKLPTLMAPCNRFRATGPNKTIGFLLFNESETEIMRYNLEKRVGSLLPQRPKTDTKIFRDKEKKKKAMEQVQKEHSRVVAAVEEFLRVLEKYNTDDQEFISKEELKAALEDETFCVKHKETLFGKDCKLDRAFEILDKDGNNRIAFLELVQFIEERGIRMQMRFQGYGREEVKSFGGFLSALQGTLLTNMKYLSVTEADEHRTVGINTGHVGTMDYTLEEADRDFVVDRGYNATLSFLRYYTVKNPTSVKKRDMDSQDKQTDAVHDANANGTIPNGNGVIVNTAGIKETSCLLGNN